MEEHDRDRDVRRFMSRASGQKALIAVRRPECYAGPTRPEQRPVVGEIMKAGISGRILRPVISQHDSAGESWLERITAN